MDCGTWVQSPKLQNNLGSFQRKPFNITPILIYALATDGEEAEVDLLKLTRPYRTINKKSCPFHHGDWNAEIGSQGIGREISDDGY